MLAVTLYFACGVAFGRVVRGTGRVSAVLNLWVVNVALPALILAKLPGLAIGEQVAVPVAVAWTLVVLGAGGVLVAARAGGFSRAETGALLMIVPLGNTSFLGLPVVQALLGQDHLPSALAFDQLGTFLALATYGLLVAGRLGHGDRGWRPVARRLFRFAPFLALLASVPLRAVTVPAAVHDLFSVAGRTVAPVALLSMGMRFVPRMAPAKSRVILTGLALKMVLMPAAVTLAAVLFGDLTSVAWQSTLLESAMPPMVTAGVLAVSAGFDEETVVGAVGLGTIAALVVFSAVSLAA